MPSGFPWRWWWPQNSGPRIRLKNPCYSRNSLRKNEGGVPTLFFSLHHEFDESFSFSHFSVVKSRHNCKFWAKNGLKFKPEGKILGYFFALYLFFPFSLFYLKNSKCRRKIKMISRRCDTHYVVRRKWYLRRGATLKWWLQHRVIILRFSRTGKLHRLEQCFLVWTSWTAFKEASLKATMLDVCAKSKNINWS